MELRNIKQFLTSCLNNSFTPVVRNSESSKHMRTTEKWVPVNDTISIIIIVDAGILRGEELINNKVIITFFQVDSFSCFCMKHILFWNCELTVCFLLFSSIN